MSLLSDRGSAKRPFPVASEGIPLIAVLVFITVYLAVLGLSLVALFFFAATCFLGFFFRDPERVIPEQEGALVSPADGKIVEVRLVEESEFAREERLKISVFMSVFDVHVNRAPVDSMVTDICYHPGQFFSADRDLASRDNERNAIYLETSGGHRLIVVQVAGLIARRIVCRIRKRDRLRRGERFGMICFGSRLDVYLPPDTLPAVSVGNKVLAGMSVLGYLT